MACVSAAALLSAAPAAAQSNRRWDGSQSDNWFTTGNWTAAFVPTAVDNALIDNSLGAPVGAVIRNGGAVAATVAVSDNSLEVTTGGTLTVGNSLSVGTGGTFTARNCATVTVNASPSTGVRINDGGIATIDNATLTTSGIVEVGLFGTNPGSLLSVVNGGVVDLTGLDKTVFVGGTTDGTLQIGNGGTAGTVNAATVQLGSTGSKVSFQHTGTTTFAPAITGVGQVEVTGTGTTILTGANTYTGGTTIAGGTLQAGAVNVFGTLSATTVAAGATLDLNSFNQTLGSLGGAGNVTLGAATLTVGGNNGSTTFSGVIAGLGELTKVGSGTLTLSGINPYTGATTVNAGGLIVNGSIVTSSGLTVNTGSFVGGTGTLPTTAINGGTLAPGNSVGTITVNGNLSFGNNAVYLVEVTPTAADRTIVTGAATLSGTLNAMFGPGSYVARSYTLLSAGALSGTFGTFNTTDLPAGFSATLGYTSTELTLSLSAQLQQQVLSGNGNQQAVAGAIDAFFNGGGTLPPPFVTLFGLSGAGLGNALTQLSGEIGTGAAGAGFQATGQFLGLMLDPFLGSQLTDAPAQPRAIGLAPESQVSNMPKEILAFGPNGKINPAALVDRRWGVWGTAYGATARLNGDSMAGSNQLTATTGGFAAGIDYRAAPDAVIGLAIAGGALNYGINLGGNGKGDTIQAGFYGSKIFGASYIAAALAVARHALSTDRTVAFGGISDHLTAEFVARSVGARIEAGHRFPWMRTGFTPYGALQAQWLRTPGYSERDTTGLVGGFALTYDPQTTRETRSEVGARLDSRLALQNDSILILRARGAWAHEFNVDRSIHALFQSLPGAGFTVIGAEPARNAALVSGGAELKLANGVTIGAKLDGEFAQTRRLWGGSSTIRVVW